MGHTVHVLGDRDQVTIQIEDRYLGTPDRGLVRGGVGVEAKARGIRGLGTEQLLTGRNADHFGDAKRIEADLGGIRHIRRLGVEEVRQ
jgi:hypothetical protein